VEDYPSEARSRLEAAGFVDIDIQERDAYREMGMPPYPPSRDVMLYVCAWKRARPAGVLDRAREAMAWVYRRLDPSKRAPSEDPEAILAGEYALCIGSVVALGELLKREGCDIRSVTMIAEEHPAAGALDSRIHTR
jgi:hypothetical protein